MILILDIKYLMSGIFIFLIILVLAYYTTKIVGKKSNMYFGNKNLKIVERISLGMDKSIYIISICENYYLLAVTKQNIELIDKLNPESIKDFSNNEDLNKFNGTFDMYFTKYIKQQKNTIEKRSMDKNFLTDALKQKLKEIKKQNQAIKDYADKEEKE
ncbi:flagellar biosynthetic protein FliO [Clostridiaceae bacterium 35-E11]